MNLTLIILKYQEQEDLERLENVLVNQKNFNLMLNIIFKKKKKRRFKLIIKVKL